MVARKGNSFPCSANFPHCEKPDTVDHVFVYCGEGLQVTSKKIPTLPFTHFVLFPLKKKPLCPMIRLRFSACLKFRNPVWQLDMLTQISVHAYFSESVVSLQAVIETICRSSSLSCPCERFSWGLVGVVHFYDAAKHCFFVLCTYTMCNSVFFKRSDSCYKNCAYTAVISWVLVCVVFPKLCIYFWKVCNRE